MMKVNDFLDMVKKAVNSKTLYVMGGWGYPLTTSNKDRTQGNEYNRRTERKKKIYAASADTFAFDCVGLCKAVLWGWYGNADLKNGGASYASNGVPDYDAKEMMFSGCKDPTTDFSHIEAGEFLWLDGHCGIYLGDGLAAESTPIWKDGVQITAVSNIGQKSGYNSRKWTYHGHLKYVDYSAVKPEPKVEYREGEEYQVICDELNVRTKAEVSDSSTVVTVLKKGAKVKCKSTTKDSSGNMWMRIENGWICCIYNNNIYVTYSGWAKIDGKWYFYDSNGNMVKSNWVKYKGDFYYLGANGVMLTGWQTINGHRYYLYPEDGHMAQDEWIDNLFLDMSGAQTYEHKGEWKSDKKGKWWQDTSGWYPKNRYVRIGKKNYKFKADGYLS